MKTAFITGVMGQDGTYLKEILLEKGYKVIGFDKKVPTKFDVELFNVDLTNYDAIYPYFKKYSPTHVFNLAGITDVFDPWDKVGETIKHTLQLPQILMQCIIDSSQPTVFCQASSCLVFGKSKTQIQTELTPREPIYPYGFCKNFVDGLVKSYREEKGLPFCSALFYNHDSPYRGNKFFIKKLISFAKSLQHNKDKKMLFTNLDIKKDLGYAKDYMEAFVLMAESEKKDDYIISSGKLINLKDVVLMVSELSNINLLDYINVHINEAEHDKSILFGDNSKIKKELNWSPSTEYKNVVKMIWESY